MKKMVISILPIPPPLLARSFNCSLPTFTVLRPSSPIIHSPHPSPAPRPLIQLLTAHVYHPPPVFPHPPFSPSLPHSSPAHSTAHCPRLPSSARLPPSSILPIPLPFPSPPSPCLRPSASLPPIAHVNRATLRGVPHPTYRPMPVSPLPARAYRPPPVSPPSRTSTGQLSAESHDRRFLSRTGQPKKQLPPSAHLPRPHAYRPPPVFPPSRTSTGQLSAESPNVSRFSACHVSSWAE
ncbi:unnamed protein product [Closterium sp. NIES-64]|nr:unnamed protein product [Closterium sp. NIES-64]